MVTIHKKIITGIIIFCAVIFCYGIMFVPQARAITLIPPSLEIGLKPGQAYNTVIKLFNETSDTVELYTEARSFTAKGETGQPYFDFKAEPVGLGEWIDVEEGPIVIAPGERYEVPVEISPPVDADPGGHYASLFFSSTPPEEGMVRISSKIGTLLLAKVAGDVVEDGLIANFSTVDDQSVFNRLPVEFYSRFSNTGNVHLRPTGAISITNMFGKEKASVDFNASRGATLPNTTRRYETVWEVGQVSDTAGNAWTSFWKEYSNERNNFAFGKYTAALSVSAGTSQGIVDTAEVSFWVLPWHILLIWGIILVVGVFLVIFLIKKYNSWIVKKSRS